MKQKNKIIIKGSLNEEKIKKISELNGDPNWMLEIRLKAFNYFKSLPLPDFGPDLSELDFDNVIYYGGEIIYPYPNKWEELPEYIKDTIEKLGLRKEFEYLSGLVYQYDSLPVYKEIKRYLEQEGIIFMSLTEGIKEYPEIIRKYFGKIVPYTDNKFAALNTSVWSGGVFIYVPENKKIDIPLHAFFYINTESIGQFERTLIIVEKNSKVTYIEGCTAPIFSLSSLHAAVVEAFVGENSELTYATIQNWSKNVYNLVTKRAKVEKYGKVKWISAEFGSKVTMLYPGLILDDNSTGEIYTISLSKDKQIIDSGGRIIVKGKDAKGYISAKSLSFGGKATNRIDIKILETSENSNIISKCDSLIDKSGEAYSIPRIEVYNNKNYYNHEAKTEKIDEERLLYLESKGINKKDALKLIYLGFAEDALRNFPPSFQLEVRKLMDLEIEEIGGFG